jgi:hypothetical protein
LFGLWSKELGIVEEKARLKLQEREGPHGEYRKIRRTHGDGEEETKTGKDKEA